MKLLLAGSPPLFCPCLASPSPTHPPPCIPQSQLAAFLDQYVAMAAGPTKWTKLVDFLKNTYPTIMQGVVARKEEKVGRG